jgi:hypothetical protein
MPKKLTIEEQKTAIEVRVTSRFTGSVKKSFLEDIERGHCAAALMRIMARFYYSHPDRPKY